MAIVQVSRINPLDLQKNIAMGISLPFNGPAGPFNSTFSTKDQLKNNLINLLLTNKGERLFNPNFGCNLKTMLFEGLTDDFDEEVKYLVSYNINQQIPEIQIIDITLNQNRNENSITINIKYKIIISNDVDLVTVQFI